MRRSLFKTQILLLLLMVLVSCGANASTPASTITPTVNGVASDLKVYSPVGVYCVSHGIFPFNVEGNPNFPQGTLVLSTHRLNYDNSEIQQMSSYLTAYFNERLPLPAPPSTLTYAKTAGLRCELDLQLTNIGKSTIQLVSVQLKLLATPQRNTQQYFAVEQCSIPVPPNVACSGGGGAESPGNYEFHLIGGSAGQVFTPLATPQAQSLIGVEGPLLHPNDTTAVDISMYSLSRPFVNAFNIIGESNPNEYYNNLIYSFVPRLTLKLQGKVQMIDLTQFASTLYFTQLCQQFESYSLKGNVFVRDRCSF